MEFTEVLNKRSSVRAFSPQDISDSDLEDIISAADSAPSAGNLQAYRVFVVKDHEMKAKLAKAAYDQEFVADASVCMVFCSDPERSASEYGQRGRELYSIQDAAIAASFALLKAVDLGLGTVWVGAFNEFRVKEILTMERYRPVSLLLIGQPAEGGDRRIRNRKGEIFKKI